MLYIKKNWKTFRIMGCVVNIVLLSTTILGSFLIDFPITNVFIECVSYSLKNQWLKMVKRWVIWLFFLNSRCFNKNSRESGKSNERTVTLRHDENLFSCSNSPEKVGHSK